MYNCSHCKPHSQFHFIPLNHPLPVIFITESSSSSLSLLSSSLYSPGSVIRFLPCNLSLLTALRSKIRFWNVKQSQVTWFIEYTIAPLSGKERERQHFSPICSFPFPPFDLFLLLCSPLSWKEEKSWLHEIYQSTHSLSCCLFSLYYLHFFSPIQQADTITNLIQVTHVFSLPANRREKRLQCQARLWVKIEE